MATVVASYYKQFTKTTRDVTALEITNIERLLLAAKNWEEFRDWIYGVVALLNDNQLGKLWDDGYIVGFLGKEEAHEALMGEEAGVFLLRFLDPTTNQFGITIDYTTTEEGSEVGSIVVTDEELKSEGLAERIQGLDCLQYVQSGSRNDNATGKDGLTEKQVAFLTATMDESDSQTQVKNNDVEDLESLQKEFESFLQEVLLVGRGV